MKEVSGSLTILFTKLWHLVDVFTSVPAVGHAKAKVKIEHLEHSVSKVVSLDHPKPIHRFITNSELHPIYMDTKKW